MSRVGNTPVTLPQGVTATINSGVLLVKGPKGELSVLINDNVSLKQEGSEITFTPKSKSKLARSAWGTTQRLTASAVEGVSQGYTIELEIQGVGLRASMQGTKLNLQLGFSHDVQIDVPKGLTVTAPQQTQIIISGPDKQKVGQFAAEVRALKKPEPYKGKGIRRKGEYVRRKEGKKK